jgi:hypothetical protein
VRCFLAYSHISREKSSEVTVELLKWMRLQWDRALALVAAVAGVVLLIVGWIDVSSTAYVAKQIPYVVSAGLGGIAALIIAGTLWLSADLRDEWRALDRIDDGQEQSQSLAADLAGRIEVLESGRSYASNGAALVSTPSEHQR